MLRISFLTLLSNIALAIIKGVAGIVSGSAALISDAANSASDVLYGIVIIVGVRLAGRKADDKHPYGYERFESLVSMFLGAIVVLAGLFIGIDGIQKVWHGVNYTIEAPTTMALWVAAGVIIFKSFMYFFTKSRSKRYKSDVLAAAAADHGSDVLATSGVFIGVTAAQLGMPIMDPIASLVIAGLILNTGRGILVNAIKQITDQSAGPEVEEQIRSIIASHDKILGVDKVLTRIFGDRIYVDVEIKLPGDYSLCDAHEIGVRVHREVEEQIPEIKHCTVHINPCETTPANVTAKAEQD